MPESPPPTNAAKHESAAALAGAMRVGALVEANPDPPRLDPEGTGHPEACRGKRTNPVFLASPLRRAEGCPVGRRHSHAPGGSPNRPRPRAGTLHQEIIYSLDAAYSS